MRDSYWQKIFERVVDQRDAWDWRGAVAGWVNLQIGKHPRLKGMDPGLARIKMATFLRLSEDLSYQVCGASPAEVRYPNFGDLLERFAWVFVHNKISDLAFSAPWVVETKKEMDAFWGEASLADPLDLDAYLNNFSNFLCEIEDTEDGEVFEAICVLTEDLLAPVGSWFLSEVFIEAHLKTQILIVSTPPFRNGFFTPTTKLLH